jgi:phosphoesterase RecJ-like protein
MTDSGSFRFPRVDSETHRIVAHLIECGADPVRIYSEVFERWSGGRIHLLGEMLAGLKTAARGRLAYVTITQDMLKRTNTDVDDTENFTVYPMSVEGVVAGILFLELPDGVKISFRSKGDLAINTLAKEFGGNGHKNAAGAQVQGTPLSAVTAKVVSAATKIIDGA